MFNLRNRQNGAVNSKGNVQFSSSDRSEIMSILGVFERSIKQYGCSSSTVREFRKEIDSLLRQKVIEQKNRDYAYGILGMQRTNAIKWNITLERLQDFLGAKSYVESDPQGRRLIEVYEGKAPCKALQIIKDLYREDYQRVVMKWHTVKATGAEYLTDDELKRRGHIRNVAFNTRGVTDIGF